MSSPEPLLSEFMTKEELAAELRRNVRTLDRWAALGVGPPRTCFSHRALSPNERSKMATCARASGERVLIAIGLAESRLPPSVTSISTPRHWELRNPWR